MKITISLPESMLIASEKNPLIVEIINGENILAVFNKVLSDRFELLFNSDGSVRGFAKLFHNDCCVDDINDIIPKNLDKIEILTSMSGG